MQAPPWPHVISTYILKDLGKKKKLFDGYINTTLKDVCLLKGAELLFMFLQGA